jgi:hypothetical protein
MNFITDKKAKQLKKNLLNALKINKKAMDAIKNDNLPSAIYYSQKLSFRMQDDVSTSVVRDYIAPALCKTVCTDNIDNKSTASHTVFKNDWTVGCFGSVFVDLRFDFADYRIHFVDNTFCIERLLSEAEQEALMQQMIADFSK